MKKDMNEARKSEEGVMWEEKVRLRFAGIRICKKFVFKEENNEK